MYIYTHMHTYAHMGAITGLLLQVQKQQLFCGLNRVHGATSGHVEPQGIHPCKIPCLVPWFSEMLL